MFSPQSTMSQHSLSTSCSQINEVMFSSLQQAVESKREGLEESTSTTQPYHTQSDSMEPSNPPQNSPTEHSPIQRQLQFTPSTSPPSNLHSRSNIPTKRRRLFSPVRISSMFKHQSLMGNKDPLKWLCCSCYGETPILADGNVVCAVCKKHARCEGCYGPKMGDEDVRSGGGYNGWSQARGG
jgi:hypothetical protein